MYRQVHLYAKMEFPYCTVFLKVLAVLVEATELLVSQETSEYL